MSSHYSLLSTLTLLISQAFTALRVGRCGGLPTSTRHYFTRCKPTRRIRHSTNTYLHVPDSTMRVCMFPVSRRFGGSFFVLGSDPGSTSGRIGGSLSSLSTKICRRRKNKLQNSPQMIDKPFSKTISSK